MLARGMEGNLRPAFLRQPQIHSGAREIGEIAGGIMGEMLARR